MSAAAERLSALTLKLVDIASESRDEERALAFVRERMSATPMELALDTGSALLYAPPGPGAPRADTVVLAGHVDTVPAQGNRPGRRDGDTVHGLGAADMKGGVAVMLDLAERLELRETGLLFFAREELPVAESALPEALEASALIREAGLAVMLEPTDNRLEVGCLGNLNAELTVTGTAAHSARPWLGHNAIHDALALWTPLTRVEPRRVDIGGAEYVEVLSVTTIGGGIAQNVIPAEVVAHVNFRYAPDRDAAGAEERLRELTDGAGALTIVSNAPPAPVPLGNPLLERLKASGTGPVRGKQAWTPVAEFAQAGVAAVNFGPGDPAFAHRADEQVTGAALARCAEVLEAFVR